MARFDDPDILRGILEELPTRVYLVDRDDRAVGVTVSPSMMAVGEAIRAVVVATS